jgi:hypothetical protein
MKAMVAAFAGPALLLIGGVTASHAIDAASTTLTRGTYNVSAFVTKFNSTGNFCFPTVQNGFGLISLFYITYNGAGKAAEATIQVPFNPTSTPGPFMAFLSLPPTPTGSNKHWTGKYTEKLLPVGGKFTPQTFAATITATSPLSFLGTMTFGGFSDGPTQSCSISFQYAAVFVGPVK